MKASHCRNFCLNYNFGTNKTYFAPVRSCKNCTYLKDGLRDKKVCDFIKKSFKDEVEKKEVENE